MKFKKIIITFLLSVSIISILSLSSPTAHNESNSPLLPNVLDYSTMTFVSSEEYTDQYGKNYIKKNYVDEYNFYHSVFYCPEVKDDPIGEGSSLYPNEPFEGKMHFYTPAELEAENIQTNVETNESGAERLESDIQDAVN